MTGVFEPQFGGYTVQTPVYEGPLDLLLDLIERAELNITAVSLATVTDQYLAYLNDLEERLAEEISAFLVVAAKLVQIKSEALLPRPPVREPGEEDVASSLVEQLQLYKRFKEIGNLLHERQACNLHTYLRLAPAPRVEAKLDLSNLSLEDLLEAAAVLLDKEEDKEALATVISAPKITIREKISVIADMLNKDGQTRFDDLLSKSPSRIEIVVTFLALLELVKRYRVATRQNALFADIEIERLQEWDADEQLDIEFE